jgi:transmembrane sensor
MTPGQITDLLIKKLEGAINPIEEQELLKWMNASEENLTTANQFLINQNLSQNLHTHWVKEELWRKITTAVPDSIAPQRTFVKSIHRVHLLKTAWFRYAAAVVLFIGLGSLLYFRNVKKDIPASTTEVKNDIAPGYNRAMLTLSNGEKIELNNAATEIIKDGSLSIKNNNGQLSYTGSNIAAINTMSTPKGGQYQLTLSDGTKVWLNAASSITYPAAFLNKMREVFITGEAYFEVKADAKRPFIVKSHRDSVVVLGTEFNINAYPDELMMKTSLVSGSVKVQGEILEPGQAYTNGKIIATDISQDIAWRNSAFNFSGLDMASVFRMLSRWYNVDIIYKEGVPKRKIGGKIGRNLSLSEVLKIFNGMGIHTRVDGRTLIVLPD